MLTAWRIFILKARRHPAVRAVASIPGRADDIVMRVIGRLVGRLSPVLATLVRLVRVGSAKAWVRSAPWRARAARACTRAAVWADRRFPLSTRLGLLFALATYWPTRATGFGMAHLIGLLGLDPGSFAALPPGSWLFAARCVMLSGWALAVLLPVAALTACVRRRAVYAVQRAAVALFLVHALFVWRWVLLIPALLRQSDSELYPNTARNELWYWGSVSALPWVALGAVLAVVLAMRSTAAFYGATRKADGWADRLWANLRTHGGDPVFRKRLYRSGLVHLFLIFLLPMLAFYVGCDELPYGIPQGSGTPVIEVIKVRKIKKPEKKYILNLNAAISFYQPKIDESEVFEDLDKMTENTYEAQQLGKLGAGGGTKGGWPNGMENARVRFIRLEYDGGDWDQDMGFGADYNMLLKFREFTSFDIWPRTESIRIPQLKRFPKNRAPPFVYITGGLRGNINVSQSEIKILREYCLDMGGMLFADNGGGNFDRNFRALMRRVFPELPMVMISKDDVIFRQPFLFPAGAPPLWHHSGKEAMGIKHKGRWVVFYHQGDINDAWKTGHSGASPAVAAQAYKMGVNVINYAFNQYMFINFGGEVPK